MISSSRASDAYNVSQKLNYALLFAKYYFYFQKLNDKVFNLKEFKWLSFYSYKIKGLV